MSKSSQAAQSTSTIPQIKPNRSNHNIRSGRRVDIRPNEGVSAQVIREGKAHNVRVFDLSSSGICLVGEAAIFEGLKPLDELSVKVSFNWSESYLASYFICWFVKDPQGLKVGLRLNYHALPDEVDEEDRNLLPISNDYPITGYIYKDLFYMERSIVKILRLSIKSALVEILDSENVFFPGKEVELLFSLQSKNSERLRGRIRNIRNIDDRSATLSIDILELGKDLEADFVNHMILNPELTLEQVRTAGFRIKEVANHFRFRFVKTQEEYLQVLALRLDAYRSAGKTVPGADISNMVAPLDHISRILVAMHGDKIIASVALSFPESEDVILDTERALPAGYPSFVPPKKEMIEVARLCTDPNYRRGDVLLRMFEHIYRVFATTGRKYLISSTDKKLWPIYRNLGFKKMGLRYNHPYLKGIEHDLILIDISVPTSGRKIDPVRWSYLYATMTDYIEKRTRIRRSLWGATKKRIYGIFKRLSKRKPY